MTSGTTGSLFLATVSTVALVVSEACSDSYSPRTRPSAARFLVSVLEQVWDIGTEGNEQPTQYVGPLVRQFPVLDQQMQVPHTDHEQKAGGLDNDEREGLH